MPHNNFCRHREWKPQNDGMPPSMFEPNPNFLVAPSSFLPTTIIVITELIHSPAPSS